MPIKPPFLTKDQKNITATALLLIVLGVVILLACLNSCTSPYKLVAQKANPTDKERTYLSVACIREFPVITNIFSFDSIKQSIQKNYSKQIDSLLNVAELLDSIIHDQQPIIDTAFVDSSNCLPRIKIAYSEIEKLNNQRNILQASIVHLKSQLTELQKNYKPCDSVIYQTSKTTVCDSAKMFLLQAQFKGKSDSLIIMSTKYQDKKDTSKNELWIIIALGIALVTGIVLKIKKVI